MTMKATKHPFSPVRYFMLLGILFPVLLSSCGARPHTNQDRLAAQKEAALQAELKREAAAMKAALAIADSLSEEELAAQVLMTGITGKDHLDPAMGAILQEIPVGAIMLFKYNIADTPQAVHAFIRQCTEQSALRLQSPIPMLPGAATAGMSSLLSSSDAGSASASNRLYPFVAIDHEGGAVFRLGQVATRLPSAARYLSANSAGGDASSTDQASVMDSWHIIRQAAYLSGRELRALGIAMNLAPVAEVLTPENREFLQNRSFATEPAAAASAAAAFIQGMGEAGVVSVVKHFPSSAAADPHYGKSVLAVDKERLEYLAAPFTALLTNRGDRFSKQSPYPQNLLSLPILSGGVMVAHTLVPVIDPELPASLSRHFMQDWIKRSLGFQGIVVADDFTMKAVTSLGISPEAAIPRAILAGADMVMVWPRDLRRFHRLLVERAKSDTLFHQRLVDAARRIINLKLLWGLTEGTDDFNDEGYGCMRKATEQFLRERNLR
ncbi:MAG TPA: glycoside hydrolase family 3 N-terminal domain-containing protein [Treponema sp.]|nr:glycoside hydrolase family 3 N-terminal domain-containing protein [Treponema sp.]HPC72317.1 glycoside hydrolase family 3 N-terminal domain-containing protein [Treponema sp.]